MPDTLIGAGKTLNDMVLGLDAIVNNEALHFFQKNNRLYTKCKIKLEDGEYRIYMTGDAQIGIFRKTYNEKGAN